MLTEAQKIAKRLRAQKRRDAKKTMTEAQITAKTAKLAPYAKPKFLCTIDGKPVHKGDWVCFKADIETYGKAIEVRGTDIVLEMRDSTTEETWTTQEPIKRCWIE